MYAYLYRDRIALDSLVRVEQSDPIPGPRDLVLRMRAVALNFRDLAVARGNYHAASTPPLIPLSDGAGEVVAVGAEVTRFRVGDLVCPSYVPEWIDGALQREYSGGRLGGPGQGVFVELMRVHEQHAVRAPAHLDAIEAATLPVAAVTAWHALYRTAVLRPGETLLVQGTGGVSIAALQLARLGGARVIAVTRSDQHAARLRALGASDVLPIGATDTWPDEVLARTGGRGVDAAIEVTGGTQLARTIAATRLGGRVHLVGYTADTTAGLDIFDAIRHAITIHAATAGSRVSFEELVRAADLHQLRPVVDRVFPAERWADAFGQLAERARFGKLVLALP